MFLINITITISIYNNDALGGSGWSTRSTAPRTSWRAIGRGQMGSALMVSLRIVPFSSIWQKL